MNLYILRYTGPFGFIKPWTAVRDSETYSQQFLTPSIVAGIERKLFPELLKRDYGIYKIKRHRLSYESISEQMEVTQTRGFNKAKLDGEIIYTRGSYKNKQVVFAPIIRGVLVNPILLLCFDNMDDALEASSQHICLARNEDMLLPDKDIIVASVEEFDNDEEQFSGFELIFEDIENSFLVGYNRFNSNQAMMGWLKVVGNPIKCNY